VKLAVRILALSFVVAGGAAAAITPKTPAINSHQSATATMPVPGCVPGLPTCPTNQSGK
jgi:hypothetical protein